MTVIVKPCFFLFNFSDSLREALGLNSASVPMYIYRMRLYGYPPGWLEEAKTKTASGMSMFDKHGRRKYS